MFATAILFEANNVADARVKDCFNASVGTLALFEFTLILEGCLAHVPWQIQLSFSSNFGLEN
jgi:hypothetical protein